MSWILTLSTGICLGFTCFGGLWLTVLQAIKRPHGKGLIAVSQVARLSLVCLVLCVLSRGGMGNLLSAAAGVWIARWQLIRRVGAVTHGR